MRLHIVTIGEPKLAYARQGWEEYIGRLGRFHALRSTHLADKYTDDASQILAAAGNAYKIVMEIQGRDLASDELAGLLEKRAQEGRELCFIIGGPDGLPQDVIDKADMLLSLSALTFPHDLAMVVLAEALYRASTINAGHPYHRA